MCLKIKHFKAISLCLMGLFITACEVGPDFHKPQAPDTNQYVPDKLPQKTMATTGAKNAANAQSFSQNTAIADAWWQVFGSPIINSHVQEGLANNLTLGVAKATLKEAQADLDTEIGDLLFPSFDFLGYGKRLRTSPISFGSATPNTIFNLYNATTSVSYLLDVWGGSRRTIEAYKAQVNYQQFELQSAYLTISSNIVNTIIGIASLNDQIAATKALIKAQTGILKMTSQQYRLGGTSKEDLLLQETTLAQTQASLPPLDKALQESTHSLAVLVGHYTSEQKTPQISLNQLHLPSQLPYKLPSSLVEQRPDIQASQAVLHAANAQIGVVTANLLPQFTLTGDYGFLSQKAKDFFSKKNNIWNYGLNVSQPVFHGGALWSARESVKAVYQAAFESYQETVLNALQNVADALTAIQYDAIEYNRNYAANISAKETYDITRKQYRLGGVDYLTVLNAQEKYDQTLLALIKVQAARYSDTVSLYAALGGNYNGAKQ